MTSKEIHIDERKETEKIKKKLTRRQKIIRWSIVFLMIVIFTCVGLIALSFKDVFKKNKGLQAPFFKFFQKVNPASLRGEGDGRINYLILGYGGGNHPGAYLTDTVMVASIDPYNKKAALLSIPRDLYVPIPGYDNNKINAAYSIGQDNKEQGQNGPDLAKETVSNILDIPIHYYIVLDFNGFEKIIDLVGGVDVYVDEDIYDPYYPDDNWGQEVYSIKAGWHHFNGADALKYARSRYTTSDFDRAKRQQKIMIALKDKVLSLNFLSNPAKVISLMSTLGGSIQTDLIPQEIIKSFDLVKDLKEDQIATKVLDDSSVGLLYADNVNGMYVLKPKDPTWEEVKALAHSIFIEPFLEKEKAQISIENGSGNSGLALKVSDFLKSRGYQITNFSTAEDLTYNTKIADCSNGEKPYTLEFLKKRFFNPEIISCPQDLDNQVDFVVILGQDFDYTSFVNNKI